MATALLPSTHPFPLRFSPTPSPKHRQFSSLPLPPEPLFPKSNPNRSLKTVVVRAESLQSLVSGAVNIVQSNPPTWQSALLTNLLIFVAGSPILALGLSVSGIASAFLLGTLTWRAFGPSGFLLVATYFVIGTAATKVKMAQKEAQGVAEKRKGRRGLGSVIGSSAAGCVCALLMINNTGGEAFRQLWRLGFVACFCTKLSDTVSSEIGKAYGRITFQENFQTILIRIRCLNHSCYCLDQAILWNDSNHEFRNEVSLLLILIIKVIHSKTFTWVDSLSFLEFLDNLDQEISFFNKVFGSNPRSFIISIVYVFQFLGKTCYVFHRFTDDSFQIRYLVTTFRIVPRGTEGAVSLEGTFAGLLAASVLAFVGCLLGDVTASEAIVCVVASQIANLGESIIGAVLQEKEGFQWLNNDVVNVINISIGSVLAILMQQLILGH